MPIVGIDLGTTNSLVAVLGEHGPVTLENELGDHLTPSAVAIARDGSILVGRAARDRLVVAPEAGRAFAKRDMGTPTTYEFGGRRWTPTECSAAILRELKRIAERALGSVVEAAVVTVPAYFHEPQRKATMDAAKIAGLRVEAILNEPTAAALAFGWREAGVEKHLLVLDLGGGTFDVTVLETFEGIIEVKASGGDGRLGGEDFTDALLDVALRRAGIEVDAAARARARQRAEVGKRRLSSEDAAELDLGRTSVVVTRAEFEAATRGLVARLRPIVRRCLRDARVGGEDLDDVLLVGGATRMPSIIGFAREEFSREPNRSLDPDRVVALGAAVQAARIERHEAIRDLVMTDVCPHSLGVAVAKRFGTVIDPGHFAPILERNRTVPISRSEPFSTMAPAQDSIRIEIFQGESRRTAENTFLGAIEMRGLRHQPGQRRPGEIEVRFTYDANGILEVEAAVLETGTKRTLVLESRPGSMSPEQVAEAVRLVQPLKVRPRDLLPHRSRLERADRLYADLVGEARADLGLRLDAYETALESGESNAIGFAAACLDEAIADAYEREGEAPSSGPEGAT